MLTSDQAATALLRWSPSSAPITWRQLAPVIGVSSPAQAKRIAGELAMGRGRWATAQMYDFVRQNEGRDWPDPFPLVKASLEELLEGRRVPHPRAAAGELTVRPAHAGERYRTCNYGRRRSRNEGEPDGALPFLEDLLTVSDDPRGGWEIAVEHAFAEPADGGGVRVRGRVTVTCISVSRRSEGRSRGFSRRRSTRFHRPRTSNRRSPRVRAPGRARRAVDDRGRRVIASAAARPAGAAWPIA